MSKSDSRFGGKPAGASIINSLYPITVIVVDDHQLARRRVTSLLSEDSHIHLVGEAADSRAAISLIRELQPDVVVLGIRSQGSSRVEVAEASRSTSTKARLLVFTASDYEGYVCSLVKAGVSGYLPRAVSGEELRKAIRDVAAEGLSFPPGVGRKVARPFRNNNMEPSSRLLGKERARRVVFHPTAAHGDLTIRERQALEYIALGLSNREIADAMGIGIKTVEGHIGRLFRRLGARNRTHAVVTALQLGWHSSEPPRDYGA